MGTEKRILYENRAHTRETHYRWIDRMGTLRSAAPDDQGFVKQQCFFTKYFI
jgi:hypothetical protein